MSESVMPVKPRREGAVFDTFFGNPWVNRCRLEDIAVPTLIIHAADDALAPYKTAANAAARMPRARFVTIESGGHEFLGHEADVRATIRAIIEDLGTAQTEAAHEKAAGRCGRHAHCHRTADQLLHRCFSE